MNKEAVWVRPVNELMDHLMVSNSRRPWSPETPDALKLHCRPFWGLGIYGLLRNRGLGTLGGFWVLGNLTCTTFSVKPSYHSGRAGPFVPKHGSPILVSQYYAQVRRTALKKLLLKDFMQEDCELRNIGLAYAPPDP
uniref:SFRICE_036838 n=1 Tax=Spodoptera frugiperda TaxID=7108 RepID=A0A2H1W3T7_SPOFR